MGVMEWERAHVHGIGREWEVMSRAGARAGQEGMDALLQLRLLGASQAIWEIVA